MVMVDDVEALIGAEHDRDHVLADHLGALLLGHVLAPALALLLHLADPDGHLGRTQRHDRDRMNIGLADVRHGKNSPWHRDRRQRFHYVMAGGGAKCRVRGWCSASSARS